MGGAPPEDASPAVVIAPESRKRPAHEIRRLRGRDMTQIACAEGLCSKSPPLTREEVLSRVRRATAEARGSRLGWHRFLPRGAAPNASYGGENCWGRRGPRLGLRPTERLSPV